eukprot:5604287-Amphidinium_carterae.2
MFLHRLRFGPAQDVPVECHRGTFSTGLAHWVPPLPTHFCASLAIGGLKCTRPRRWFFATPRPGSSLPLLAGQSFVPHGFLGGIAPNLAHRVPSNHHVHGTSNTGYAPQASSPLAAEAT